MELPPELKSEIQARFDRAKESSPGRLSKDGTAVHICGSIGFDCYLLPDGDLFMETYELLSGEPPVVDRSREAQISCLIIGSEYTPSLSRLLPERPQDALTCDTCKGAGWLHRDTLGPRGLLCHDCSGLGWIEVS